MEIKQFVVFLSLIFYIKPIFLQSAILILTYFETSRYMFHLDIVFRNQVKLELNQVLISFCYIYPDILYFRFKVQCSQLFLLFKIEFYFSELEISKNS